MQQALEALEWGSGTYDRRNAAITALKQALAEPEQHDTDCHAQGICQRSGYSIAPTLRKPLTVFEIDAIAEHLDKTTIGWATHEFAAAIEKAHGIGEQHE
jgi:hypothetical protein